MKIKITQFIPVALALLAIGFSYFSLWCTEPGYLCYRTWIDRIFLDIINPLYFFSLFFLLVAIILIFVPQKVFHSWLKFAAWAIPLSIVFIALIPVNYSGIGINFFPFYRDDAARLMGELFAGISLILIIYKIVVIQKGRRPVKGSDL